MPRFARHFALATAALLSLLLVACGSPVNQENFQKIVNGMTQAEVEDLLGRPDESSSASLGTFSGGSSTWTSGDVTITVQFMNDQVQFKQFTKGTDGEQ
ncbi:MAG: DUF3862 domain-containing protein [Thiohalobacteraceae bacterium]